MMIIINDAIFVFIGENFKLVVVCFWNYAPEPVRDEAFFLIKQSNKSNNSTCTQDILVVIMISHTCRTVPEKLPPTPSQKMSTCGVDHDQCWRYCRRLWWGWRRWGLMKNSSRRCLPVMLIKLMMTGEVGLMRMMIRIQDNCFLV